MIQKVKDGWNLMYWQTDTAVEVVYIGTIGGIQQLKGSKYNDAWNIPSRLNLGYSFTPLIEATPSFIAAANELMNLAQYDIDQGYRRDDDSLKTALADMRAAMEGLE